MVWALDAAETPVLGPDGSVQNAEKLSRLDKLDHALKGLHGSQIMVAYRPPSSPANLPPSCCWAYRRVARGARHRSRCVPPNFPPAVLVGNTWRPSSSPGWCISSRVSADCRFASRRRGNCPQQAPCSSRLPTTTSSSLATGLSTTLRVRRLLPGVHRWMCCTRARAVAGRDGGRRAPAQEWARTGAEGLLRLRILGWHTIAQDEATCVVYGMPKVAAEKRAPSKSSPVANRPGHRREDPHGREGVNRVAWRRSRTHPRGCHASPLPALLLLAIPSLGCARSRTSG